MNANQLVPLLIAVGGLAFLAGYGYHLQQQRIFALEGRVLKLEFPAPTRAPEAKPIPVTIVEPEKV